MPDHEHYEALCALASGGLLERAELVDFRDHLKNCSKCRSDHMELSVLFSRELPKIQHPFRQRLAAMRAKPLPYAEERFLRRARGEGLVFSRDVEKPVQSNPWYFSPVALLAPLSVLVVAAVGLAIYHFQETPGAAQMQKAAVQQQNGELQQENSSLTSRLSQSSESIATQQREILSLRAQLESATAAAEKLRRNNEQAQGEIERSSSQTARLLDESRDQEKMLTEARDEAARSSQLRTNAEASLVEQQTRITELSNKLRVASATLDMERQLAAAGKDIPELMAARQLHVIDVHNNDPNGNRSKAFGRIFLTEGRSLTFYAFDLNEDMAVNPKRSFQVWAASEAGKDSAHSLGLLRVDPKAPGRWVLKVENPELVKDVSSVFITNEPAAGGKHPDGQKMLAAYLGQANHP
jgi:hypothetical protein